MSGCRCLCQLSFRAATIEWKAVIRSGAGHQSLTTYFCVAGEMAPDHGSFNPARDSSFTIQKVKLWWSQIFTEVVNVPHLFLKF